MNKALLLVLLFSLLALQVNAVYSVDGKQVHGNTTLAAAPSITVANEKGYAVTENIQAVAISPDGLEVKEEGKLMLPYAIESNVINAEVVAAQETHRVRVTQEGEFVVLESNGVKANTTQMVQIQERTMLVAQQQLQLMPDQAQAMVQEKLQAQVQAMELVKDNEGLAYKARVLQQKQLLWLFQVNAEGDAFVDAETGEVRSPQGPWYSFLFTG